MQTLTFSISCGVFVHSLLFNHTFLLIFISLLILISIHDALLQSKFHTKFLQKWQVSANAIPDEPRINTRLNFRARPIRDFIQKYNQNKPKEEQITFTHLIVLAFGRASLKAKINLKYVFEEGVELPCLDMLCAVKTLNSQMAPYIFRNTESVNLPTLRKKSSNLKLLKTNKDDLMNGMIEGLGMIPFFLLSPMLRFSCFLNVELGLPLPSYGKPSNYGHLCLSNVGTFGNVNAVPCFLFYTKFIMIAITSGEEKHPISANKVERVIPFSYGADARLVSSSQISMFNTEMKKLLDNPENLLENN